MRACRLRWQGFGRASMTGAYLAVRHGFYTRRNRRCRRMAGGISADRRERGETRSGRK